MNEWSEGFRFSIKKMNFLETRNIFTIINNSFKRKRKEKYNKAIRLVKKFIKDMYY